MMGSNFFISLTYLLFATNLYLLSVLGFVPLNRSRLPSPRCYHPFTFTHSLNTGSAACTPQSVNLSTLYPASDTITHGTLQVDNVHTLYYEIHGSRDNPWQALVLHGGPGAGCYPRHARFFNTSQSQYQVVLLDQRGSGRSIPRGDIRNNTLQDLIEDCEKLRKHLYCSHNIDQPQPQQNQNTKWDVILGGSWGTTLAVAYANRYPTSMRSLILRAICQMRPCEIDWMFTETGVARYFPHAWQEFASAVVPNLTTTSTSTTTNNTNTDSVSQQYCSDPRAVLHAYYDRLLGNDPTLRIKAAQAWMKWEMTVYASSSAASEQADFYGKAYSPVAVWDGTSWSYRDSKNQILDCAVIERQGLPNNCTEAVNRLRVGLIIDPPESFAKTMALPTTTIRRVQAIQPHTTPVNATLSSFQNDATSFVPAQNMLTCFYSVNDQYTLQLDNNYDDVKDDNEHHHYYHHHHHHHHEWLSRIPSHIYCIAVHGGRDRVCPPDTVLDLLSRNDQNMELRIPLQSGHSMFDIAIRNELVQATHRMMERLQTHK